MKKNTLYTLSVCCFSALLWNACVDSKDDELDPGNNNGPSLRLSLFGYTQQDIIDNTHVYFFDGEGPEIGQFRQKAHNVTRSGNTLSMPVEAGTWNVGIVGADVDIANRIITPVRGASPANLKMWETPAASSGTLEQMPELRTSFLSAQQVLPGQTNTVTSAPPLSRNVAMVKVVIDEARGLKTSGHKLRISDVPTSLNWEGKLLPNKNNPTTGTVTGEFTIANHPTKAGFQCSDTLEFIVPAHKGSDYLSIAPTDTTTHHMKLSVELACEGAGGVISKQNLVIPRVTRVNGVLLVKLHVLGNIEVSADILPWQDVQIDADVSNTQLAVNKASVGLAHKDTLYVQANRSKVEFKVDPTASAWLKVNDLGQVSANEGNYLHALEIVADLTSYVDNNPRSAYITLKTDNLTKKIPILQRPERGTIKADINKVVLAPVEDYTNRVVTITSIGGEWEIIKSTTKVNVTKWKIDKIVFARKTDPNNQNEFDNVYGNDLIIVKNTSTLDTDTIELNNLFIHIDNDVIEASAPTGTQTQAETRSQDVTVYGGNQTIAFDQWESWIHNPVWDPANQILIMTTDREPQDEERDGYITFHHTDCPDYIIKVKVHQSIIVTIPPFDFFVLKFTWAKNDVDIAVEFAGNSLAGDGSNNNSYDKKPVGWHMADFGGGYMVMYKDKKLLEWGGDEQNGGKGESAFFNAPVLENDANSPRKIRLEIYSNWYSGYVGDNMTFSMYAYKGGVMQSDDYSFVNKGGIELYNEDYQVKIMTASKKPNEISPKPNYTTYATGGYTHVATLIYDRVKHSASVNIHAGVARSVSSSQTKELSQQYGPLHPPTPKPQFPPNIVYTYPYNYKGKRHK